MQIGTDEAYAALAEALKTSQPRQREAILNSLMATRDERAAPLFVHILGHTDHRGDLEPIYLSAIEALGRLGGDGDSVTALSRVLRRGEWWAPLRTARLRAAAAHALKTCGSEAAQQALAEVAADGPRGARRAARAALKTVARAGRSN